MTNPFQAMLRDQMRLTMDKMVADALKLTPYKYIPVSTGGVFDTDGTPSTAADINIGVSGMRDIHDELRGVLDTYGREQAWAPVHVADLVFVDGALDDGHLARLGAVLADPLLQTGTWARPDASSNGPAVEITLHPGVTDTAAAAVVRAATQLGVPVDGAATGRRIELPPGMDAATVDVLLRRLVANPV
ncbi:MAG: hypothetical protein GEV00_23575, partial [Actinophytocola sp.]|nr:hypothetical protein [Actinophytocola sp.]